MNLRFLSFDEQPVAAASIAQVHHAFLKDNQEVAVKVIELCLYKLVFLLWYFLQDRFNVYVAVFCGFFAGAGFTGGGLGEGGWGVWADIKFSIILWYIILFSRLDIILKLTSISI